MFLGALWHLGCRGRDDVYQPNVLIVLRNKINHNSIEGYRVSMGFPRIATLSLCEELQHEIYLKVLACNRETLC